MRQPEHVVAAAKEHVAAARDGVGKDVRELFGQQDLSNAEVMVEPGLRRPADVQGAVDVGLAPVHEFDELGPVVDRLKVHALDRSARDDHAVELLIADVCEGLVEALKMALGGVAAHVRAHVNELQRRVAQKARKLRLGRDLVGHQIDEHDAQRTDVLSAGALLAHDEDVFLPEHLGGGQGIGDLNGHAALPD